MKDETTEYWPQVKYAMGYLKTYFTLNMFKWAKGVVFKGDGSLYAPFHQLGPTGPSWS